MSAEIQAVIFDVGGVLVPFQMEPALQKLAAKLNLTVEELHEVTGQWRDAWVTGKMRTEDFWDNVMNDERVTTSASVDELTFTGLGKDWEPEQVLMDFAIGLKASGYQIAILSDTITPHAELIRSKGVYEPFDPVVLSHEVGLRKPDPAIYQLTLERLGLPAAETVFIDDTPENIEAAKALGMHGVVCENPDQVQAELIQLGVTVRP